MSATSAVRLLQTAYGMFAIAEVGRDTSVRFTQQYWTGLLVE